MSRRIRYPSEISQEPEPRPRPINTNFESYNHIYNRNIFAVIIILSIIVCGILGMVIYLYEENIKNKSTLENNLGLACMILLGLCAVSLFIMIYYTRKIWQKSIEEDQIVSSLTVVAAEKPTLRELQDRIGDLVHAKLGNDNIDKKELTDYIFGRLDDPGRPNSAPKILRDKKGNIVAAASGLGIGPSNLFYSREEANNIGEKAYVQGLAEGQAQGYDQDQNETRF